MPARGVCVILKHRAKKWVPVFRKKRCGNKDPEHDGDSKKRHHALACLTLALAGCAATPHPAATNAARPRPAWAFEASDVPLDPAFHVSRLANGMRVILVPNTTPRGVGMVRMRIGAGSLDEAESERGLAHFVEHMAFEGSTHVPEGGMVPLLERQGLAFGADTNAFTNYEDTTYVLDLPRNDPALLDTALMLMRETVSELSFAPDAVQRERGVVLAEKRDRDTWQFRNVLDWQAFADPAARYTARMPIGQEATIAAATPERLRAFWARNYIPAKTVLMVVGDFDTATVEAAIARHFADWAPRNGAPQPSPGPIHVHDHGRSESWLNPAESERVTIVRRGPWLDEPDTLAQRREDLLRRIGYGIVNRRLQHLARQSSPPFRDAGFGTGAIFRAGRETRLILDAVSGHWRAGLIAAAQTWRRAMNDGFTQAEVAEQLDTLRQQKEHANAGADTRSNAALMNQAFALIHDDIVPSPPGTDLAILTELAPHITPAMVLAALKREAVMLKDPLIRYQGRIAPQGGNAALRAAWNDAMRAPLPPEAAGTSRNFAYTDFGPPGTIMSDTREALFGIREIVFANGVRLNLKHTDLVKDQVLVRLSLDGGEMLNTHDNPLATEMVPMLAAGGLGKHSQDDVQTLLAGHEAAMNLSVADDRFLSGGQTTPRDLPLQLDLMTALISDPGYRPEGEGQYRLAVNSFFLQRRASPGNALTNAIGGILSDDDPRFTLQPQNAYTSRTFARLKQDIADRLARGAIEIAIVGDIDEDKAIAQVAVTLGALPAREPDFLPYTAQRIRPFTRNDQPRIVRHTGPADQALIHWVWKTHGDTDPVEKQKLNLLRAVEQIALTDGLREKLGKAYSPGAASDSSRVWHDYGTFSVTASVSVGDLAAARAAIAASIAALRDRPVSQDMLERARAPLIERFNNDLKTNAGWMGLAARAQSEPDRLDRQLKAKQRLLAITPADLQAEAKKWFAASAVEVTVLPEGMDEKS